MRLVLQGQPVTADATGVGGRTTNARVNHEERPGKYAGPPGHKDQTVQVWPLSIAFCRRGKIASVSCSACGWRPMNVSSAAA